MPSEQGQRFNKGKSRVDLIPKDVLLALGQLCAFGAVKYAPNNWVKGLSYTETLGSLERHLYAFASGEVIDEESGAHHMVAVIWNAVALMFFELHPELYAQNNDLLGHNLNKSDVQIPSGWVELKDDERPNDSCRFSITTNGGGQTGWAAMEHLEYYAFCKTRTAIPTYSYAKAATEGLCVIKPMSQIRFVETEKGE